jgi:tetratricopeptide (TPR) repeat protein
MRFTFLLILSVLIFLAGCNDQNNDDGIFEQKPYSQLTDSIKQMPANSELYYKRGVLLFENNQPEYARKDIEKAWNISAKEEYALSLARLIKEKNSDSAISFLQSAIQKIPNSISLQVSLARGYQSKNEPDKALDICNRIINKYPGQLDALLLKAEILQAEDKPKEAIAILEQAYNYAPFDVELVHHLAYQYAESKNKKVLSLSDSLISADVRGTHPEPYLFKGIYYYNLKNYTAAINAFNQAIIKDYNYLDAHMYKGKAMFDQENFKEALKAFSLVTTITPTYADAYYWIGKTFEETGKIEDAKLNYERAYQLDKELIDAKEAAARL